MTGATSITSDAFVGELTGNAATVTTNANLTGDVTSSGNAASIAAGAVDFAHIQNVAGNSILARAASSPGVLSEVELADTQILIGNGAGFAHVPLSGDATMTSGGVVDIAADAITAAEIADDAISEEHLDATVISGLTVETGAVSYTHLTLPTKA